MSSPQAFHHLPVLYEETLSALSIKPDGVYLDGTVGGGGHSEGILKRLNGEGRLIAVDRDLDALVSARESLKDFHNVTFLHGNFHDVPQILQGERFDGILLDLGVSSWQLDQASRGFSYHEDAPLDMRMDRSKGQTAAEWLNTTHEKDIAKALYDYSDEKWAARIAKIIVETREKTPFKTTLDLVSAVDRAIPKAVRRKDEGHPARRTFQAVRIAVNDEINPLKQVLLDLALMLNPGGRLCVISFHSIEDRAVKQAFQLMKDPCTCPKDFPVCVCGKKPLVILPKGYPKTASEMELKKNPRARSAKLRVAQKIL